jgi:hypothetical protein
MAEANMLQGNWMQAQSQTLGKFNYVSIHRLIHPSRQRHSKYVFMPEISFPYHQTSMRHCCNIRHLLIPLVGAERCWSQAMEFRAQLEQEPLSYKRQHMLRRFSKASRLAAQLSELASKRCDDRTVLEADAYNLWMHGTMLFEKEVWELALAKLSRAR